MSLDVDYVIGIALMLAILGGLIWTWSAMARRPEVWNERSAGAGGRASGCG